MNNIEIRLAQKNDAAALLAVYAPYVRGSFATFEYEVPSEAEFAARIEKVTERFPWLICEIDGKIAGYFYAGLFKTRAAFQWDAELSVYLSPEYHRMGIASALYSCFEAILTEQGYLNLYALITAENTESIELVKSKGFCPLCVYPATGFKLSKWRDLAVLAKRLAPLPENPQPCKTFRELEPAFFDAQLQKAAQAIREKTK